MRPSDDVIRHRIVKQIEEDRLIRANAVADLERRSVWAL
jgi:hypothetical protein